MSNAANTFIILDSAKPNWTGTPLKPGITLEEAEGFKDLLNPSNGGTLYVKTVTEPVTTQAEIDELRGQALAAGELG